jgi:hypothetical protein
MMAPPRLVIVSSLLLAGMGVSVEVYDRRVLLPQHERIMEQVNDKEMIELDRVFTDQLIKQGIVAKDVDVLEESCKRAMNKAVLSDYDNLVRLTNYYVTGPVIAALRDDYTVRTADGKQLPIERNVFREDCAACKTMSYAVCMRAALEAKLNTQQETRRMVVKAMFHNYTRLLPFVVRNDMCRGK